MLHINNLEELQRLEILLTRLSIGETKYPVDIFITPEKMAAFAYGEDNSALISYTWEGKVIVESSESSGHPESMRENFWKSEAESKRLSRMCHHDNFEEIPY